MERGKLCEKSESEAGRRKVRGRELGLRDKIGLQEGKNATESHVHAGRP